MCSAGRPSGRPAIPFISSSYSQGKHTLNDLISTNPAPLSLLPASVKKCGSGSVLGVDPETGVAVIIPTTCKSWWCPKCKKPKALRLQETIFSGDPERLITLTSNPAATQSPSESITLMKAGWVRLLNKIKQHTRGFQYVLIWELTKRGWPHIHIAARGPYISHAFLKYWWNAFTGAPVVNITQIKSPIHASRYIAKYFTKDQGPILRLLGHRRLVQLSRGWSLRDVKSSGCIVPTNFTWYRLPTSSISAAQEMIRYHHLPFNPGAKNKVFWFMLEPGQVIPFTEGKTLEDIAVLHPPLYKCNSPPSPVLGRPPLQGTLVF